MRLIDLTLLCILSSLMSVIVRCKRAFLHGSRPFAEEERPVKEVILQICSFHQSNTTACFELQIFIHFTLYY